jgi:hypothetical protein
MQAHHKQQLRDLLWLCQDRAGYTSNSAHQLMPQFYDAKTGNCFTAGLHYPAKELGECVVKIKPGGYSVLHDKDALHQFTLMDPAQTWTRDAGDVVRVVSELAKKIADWVSATPPLGVEVADNFAAQKSKAALLAELAILLNTHPKLSDPYSKLRGLFLILLSISVAAEIAKQYGQESGG